MANLLIRRSAIAVSFAALSIVACDEVGGEFESESPEPLAPAAEEEAIEVAEQSVTAETVAPLLYLTDFTATFDATTGELTIVQVEPDDWSAIEVIELADGTLRTVREPLWCDLQVGRSSGQIELNTVVGSVADNPDDCGFGPTDPFYSRYADDTGMFCATVSAVSHWDVQLDNVHAQITEITDGFFGHRYPFGTGANLADLPAGTGLPNDLMGLWSFGDLLPDEDSRVQWSFENPGGSFEFSGSLVGTFAESCNGRDDNCDGRIDEGAGCFIDGAICTDAEDCVSGVCTDDRCGLSTVENRDILQIGGGNGSAASPSHNLELRIGAPSPMGSSSSDGHDVVLGPLHRP